MVPDVFSDEKYILSLLSVIKFFCRNQDMTIVEKIANNLEMNLMDVDTGGRKSLILESSRGDQFFFTVAPKCPKIRNQL